MTVLILDKRYIITETQAVKLWLELNGITMRDVAAELGMSFSYLRNMLSEAARTPFNLQAKRSMAAAYPDLINLYSPPGWIAAWLSFQEITIPDMARAADMDPVELYFILSQNPLQEKDINPLWRLYPTLSISVAFPVS